VSGIPGPTSSRGYDKQVTQRWINHEKQRYYTVRLEQDLFGDWTLVSCWGGRHSKRGGMQIKRLEGYEQGLAAIEQLAKRRRQHGYALLEGSDHDEALIGRSAECL
jgi:predicted DNA-binding WGR domain protein